MSAAPRNDKFSDLLERTQSAFVLVALGLGVFWIGGDAVVILLTIVCALMAWEVANMHSKNVSAQVGLAIVAALGFLASFGLGELTRFVYVPLVVGVVMVGKMRSRLICIIATVAIVEISLMLEEFNWITGLTWTLWLIAVVAATDIGGYFAGKFIGGPKILPRISPKKTWSGTVGGWVLAILVSALYVYLGYGSLALLPATLFVAIASQIGDMMESSIKRHAGVKDASNLIPGHGGLLDRFDGLLGATFVVGVLSTLGLLPVLGLIG